jgi:hypothetical protein
MKGEFTKEKERQLAKNRERLIRQHTPIHSKMPSQEWYQNYDRIFKRETRGQEA